ncbi:MAG TPA: macrolide ABC transporter ATP-binding protein [Planctomycetes bacterium]|nr:macrolide ABC transporter ATP-binding protein [Planctomycetota bacterium]
MIALENCAKMYGNGESAVRALAGITLRVERGESVAVRGPSGSGKSTLLHILGLLDRPTAGRYLLAGADVTRLGDRERSRIRNRTIGFVFQNFQLLPRLTALQNVCLPLLYAGRRDAADTAREALARLGLAARTHHRPGALSGGEQQRVAIARALVKDPELILADEPTGNLDSRTGGQILDLLGAIHAQGVTLVIVTHDDNVAARARRVIAMADGAVAADTSA